MSFIPLFSCYTNVGMGEGTKEAVMTIMNNFNLTRLLDINQASFTHQWHNI